MTTQSNIMLTVAEVDWFVAIGTPVLMIFLLFCIFAAIGAIIEGVEKFMKARSEDPERRLDERERDVRLREREMEIEARERRIQEIESLKRDETND